jgi:hypothetical protein
MAQILVRMNVIGIGIELLLVPLLTGMKVQALFSVMTTFYKVFAVLMFM